MKYFLSFLLLFPFFLNSLERCSGKHKPHKGEMFMWIERRAPHKKKPIILISHFDEKLHMKKIKKRGWFRLQYGDIEDLFFAGIPIRYNP